MAEIKERARASSLDPKKKNKGKEFDNTFVADGRLCVVGGRAIDRSRKSTSETMGRRYVYECLVA